MNTVTRPNGLARRSWGPQARFRAPRIAGSCLTLLLIVGACSEPEPYKPTFMGRTEGVREPAAKPEGLNPLGAIETCTARPVRQPSEERVLVARPELFTREASLMMSSLRQAIADNYHGRRTVKFFVTANAIQNEAQAVAEGRRCASLIVLWEIYGTRALELTVPEPTRIPLKVQLHPRLCEFGNYAEQLQILFLTITGLLATLEDDYETANSNMELANRIDNRCLQLPKIRPPGVGGTATGGTSPLPPSSH